MSRSNFLPELATAFVLALPGGAPAADAAPPGDVSRARIEGVVVDEAGKPVEGAVVRATSWGEKRADPVRTGQDGRFCLVLDAPVANHRHVLADRDGGAR